MDFIAYVYFFYMFVALYFLLFFILLYFKNRKKLHYIPPLKKHFSVSFVIPIWNEEKTVEGTIKGIFDSDYDNIIEVICVDNNSNDGSVKKVQELQKIYPKLKLLFEKEQGKACAINKGIFSAKGELVAIVDCDSFLGKDSISKLVGYFEDEKVGVATCPILIRNKEKFFGALQAFEYAVIAFTRRLLEFVDGIYVTPGPLALYRKKALVDIGGFDKHNLTEDIEATWHLIANGWDRKMCLETKVTTIAPMKFWPWWIQRRRWGIGGIQCMWKYKRWVFRKNMLGYFVVPFFLFQTFLGVLGISVLVYLIFSKLISQYLFVKFSFIGDTALLTSSDLYFTPSVLNYFGLVLFVLGGFFTFFNLYIIKDELLKKKNIFNLVVYLTLYLMAYPFIMSDAVISMIRGDLRWRKSANEK